jgi:rSAM/selenodomain-associated transferase 1
LENQRYPILERGMRRTGLEGICALAVMAKAPRAGRVKTRLQPPLNAEEAAGLNVCFLRDTAANIASVTREGGAQGMICYTPVGDEAAFDGLLPEGFSLIAQRGDDFGERLLCAAKDILSCGFGAVCLIDSDSPTLPSCALRAAVTELGRPGERVVVGPSDDGGYYLIGMRRANPRVFERIAWSTKHVYAETVERVRESEMDLVELPKWYDVDDAATLAVLERELLNGERPDFATVSGFDAQSTRKFLAERAGTLGATS